ncbi:hypothetical protein BD413DRAFT_125792 [Trametes elegans]|nr:hypothetical protein BD413DRAFT_125792 [Trametes elegans]
MRSPMIAFSFFAAVTPTLVVAAPPSPNLSGDSITHPTTSEIKSREHFSFARGLNSLSDVLGSLPLAGTASDSSTGASLPGNPGTGTTSTQVAGPQLTNPAAIAAKIPTKAPAGSNGNGAAPTEPKEPTAPAFVPRPPQPPTYTPHDPVTDDGDDLDGVEHNGAVPAASRPNEAKPGMPATSSGEGEATDAVSGDEI